MLWSSGCTLKTIFLVSVVQLSIVNPGMLKWKICLPESCTRRVSATSTRRTSSKGSHQPKKLSTVHLFKVGFVVVVGFPCEADGNVLSRRTCTASYLSFARAIVASYVSRSVSGCLCSYCLEQTDCPLLWMCQASAPHPHSWQQH
jgi:hypothetical protein